jgi:hypothetical protein
MWKPSSLEEREAVWKAVKRLVDRKELFLNYEPDAVGKAVTAGWIWWPTNKRFEKWVLSGSEEFYLGFHKCGIDLVDRRGECVDPATLLARSNESRSSFTPQTRSFQPTVPSRTTPPPVDPAYLRESTGATPSAGSEGMGRFRLLFAVHFDPYHGKYPTAKLRRRLHEWFEDEFQPLNREKSFEAICRAFLDIHPDKAVNMPFTQGELEELFKYFRPILQAELKSG